MTVKNKVIIVTGASSGIGLASAKLLSREGARVALVSRSREKLENLASLLPNSFAVPADMSVVTEIKSLVQKVYDHFHKIDILVNNAGRGYAASVEKIDIAKYNQLFNLNVIGPLVAMQTVIPIMRSGGGGCIINISSGTSLMHLPNLEAYASTKRVINGISLTAREELAKDKINVSVVYPYITNTNFGQNMIGEEIRSSSINNQNTKLPPGDAPEYVAEKILEAITCEKPEIYAHEWMGNRLSN